MAGIRAVRRHLRATGVAVRIGRTIAKNRGAHAGNEERDLFPRPDAAVGIAAVRARTSREEATEEHQLDVVGAGGRPLLKAVAVVLWKQETSRHPHRQRPAPAERYVAAHLRLHAQIAREKRAGAAKVRCDGDTGELKVVADEDAGVRPNGIVSEIEGRLQVAVREHHLVEARRQITDISKGKARLKVVKEARVKRAELSVDADAGAGIEITENERIVVDRKKHRIDVELAAHDSSRTRFDETGLAQLASRAIFQQETLRFFESGHLGGKKDDARSQI